jgi:hypothetical protein
MPPNKGSAYGLPTGRPRKDGTTGSKSTAVVVALPPADAVPEPPPGLTPASAAVWCDIWSAFPEGVLVPEIDGPAVQRMCELIDERRRWAAALAEHGEVIERPVQNARGDVIGSELYANPAAKELRQLDR